MDKNRRSTRPQRSRRLRTILVGCACFLLGSAALVHANSIPPGHIDAIADASNASHTVHVNASGELSSVDVGARDRLDALNTKLGPLAFAPDGGLKVATQGTNEITGSVSVDNLPAVQSVAGSVSIDNFPATQIVSVAGSVGVQGTVSVDNLPATQQIGGSVSVSNFPATQNVNITGGAVGTPIAPIVQQLAGWYSTLVGVDQGETYYFFSSPQPEPVLLMSVRTSDNVHVVCERNGTVLVDFQTHQPFFHEFFHPVMLSNCRVICIDTEVDTCNVVLSMSGS